MDDEDKEAAAQREENRGVNDINDDEEEEDDDDDNNSNKTVKQEEDYVPYPIRYCTRRTHGEATVTVTAAEVEREGKEEELVVLPFISTRQFIFHCISTTVVTLSCHPCTKSSMPTCA